MALIRGNSTFYYEGHTQPSPNSWIEVDPAILARNVQNVRDRLSKLTKLCIVLKANAYGAGIDAIMPTVLRCGVDAIGIASNEEAKVVRTFGFKGKLLRIRTGTSDEIFGGLAFGVQELVGNVEVAQRVGKIAEANGVEIPVHFALNSAGMSRDGLDLLAQRGKQDAMRVINTPGISVAGMMTHFAIDDRDEVLKCLETFQADTEWLFANSHLKRCEITLHAANSMATLKVPEAHLDMVRTGAAIYGCVGPRPEFQHVIEFKSQVVAINAYPAGNTVGYDRTLRLSRDSLLADIPVGYSDGYRRAFSNRGAVIIAGLRAPVVGKVSMNSLTVDVTDLPGVKIGDEVVLFGKQGQSEIAQSEIEEITGVVLADMFASWGTSNPRLIKR